MIKQELDYYEKIGKYILVEELGRGGSGIVYKAKDLKLGRDVAVKKLINSDDTNNEQRKNDELRFNKEARTLASLSHPNIMSVYEILKGSSNSIVVEYLEGLDLTSFIQINKPNFDTLLYIFIQIGEALSYIHSKGIIHRDIKPENITIVGKNKVKITDFGIAILENESDIFNDSLIGTLNYMSPEQLYNSKSLSAKSDIFSYGVMMYQVFTGKLPFKGNNAQEIITNIFHEIPIRPSELNNNISFEMDEIILQSIEKDSGNRFGNIQEIVDKISFERLKLSLQNINISLTGTNIINNTVSVNNITRPIDKLKTSEIKLQFSFINHQLLILLRKFIDDKRTGLINIESDEDNGCIIIKDGEIIKAEIINKSLFSVDAFFEMIVWKKGFVSFDNIEINVKSHFEYMSTELLLMEAYDVLIDYHNLTNKYKKEFLPIICDQKKMLSIYDPRVKEIFKLIDGTKTIRELKKIALMDKVSVLKCIDQLIKNNVISF